MKLASLAAAAVLGLLAAPAFADVTFTFDYLGGNTGFKDPALGESRKAALNIAAGIVGSLFSGYDADIVLEVTSSSVSGTTLASAGSAFTLNPPAATGFTSKGDVMLKILGGNAADPDSNAADGTVDWNFFHDWALGSTVGANQYDFISTAAHELLHAAGFASEIGQNGRDAYNTAPGTAGYWAPFDRWLAGQDGTTIIGATDFKLSITKWNAASDGGPGNGLRFIGPNTLATNGGNPVFIYSPTTWDNGSSGSHLDDGVYNSLYMMESRTVTGPGIRTISPIERAMLVDMGYTQVAIPEPGSLWLLLGATMALGVRRRR